jgi:hypothetical protein
VIDTEGAEPVGLEVGSTSTTTTKKSCRTLSRAVRMKTKRQSTWWGLGYIQTITRRKVETYGADTDGLEVIHIERRILPASWTS